MQQRIWHDRKTDTVNFEYRVSVNRVPYVERQSIGAMEHRMGRVSLEVRWAQMRRELMARIEHDLFKGVA